MGTIVKRGDSWRAVIRKKGHPTQTKTFSKQALAKRWVQETELAMERREVVTREAIIGDLFQRYIEEVIPARSLTKLTINRYNQLRRWTRKLSLGDLNADTLVKWKAEYCPDASPSSFDRYLSTIWGVLRDAEAFWGVDIPANDMRKTRTVLKRIGAVGEGHSRDRRPAPEEIAKIKASSDTKMPFADMIDFAMITGMRVGEITRLRWDDLDEAKKMILVRDRKHPTKKLGNHCSVPLLFGSIDILLRQPRDGELIFPFKTETVSAAWKRAKKKAKIPDLNFHDLRHEAISRMFELGYSIAEVSLVSGHLSWENLKKYTNLRPENLHAGPIAKAA